MVRTVSPVRRLSRRRTIVLKSRTIKPSRDRPTTRRGEGHGGTSGNALETFAAALALGNAMPDNARRSSISSSLNCELTSLRQAFKDAYQRATNTHLVERPPITETLER